MKIGVFGGTFNPVHIGHLVTALYAREEYGLDEIWFMPNGNPPHKKIAFSVHIRHRISMLKLAIEDSPFFRVSFDETSPDRHSYTYETMEYLTAGHPDDQFYFIMGADSLFEIETWKCFQRIFPLCTLLVADRYDGTTEKIQKKIDLLRSRYNASVDLLHGPVLEISSSMLRERIESGRSPHYLLPSSVEQYIYRHSLYRGNEKDE